MRLDQALVARGLARSRNQAARLIAAGRVRVSGRQITKPSFQITKEDITADPEPWVSRAAYKLIPALDSAGIAIPPRVLDAGASTGGFTQVCLARGAELVYAVDVGHGQLAQELRSDRRVKVIEGFNLRELTLAELDGQLVDLVVADISFISLRLLLPRLLSVCATTALLLVKPQFEVGPAGIKGGLVSDEKLRLAAVDAVVLAGERLGWSCLWQSPSELAGTHGNVEYFVKLVKQ